MSLTAAITYGLDDPYFQFADTSDEMTACVPPIRDNRPDGYPISPFYDTDTNDYVGDLNLRMAIMLAGTSVDHVKNLIDRGFAAQCNEPVC